MIGNPAIVPGTARDRGHPGSNGRATFRRDIDQPVDDLEAASIDLSDATITKLEATEGLGGPVEIRMVDVYLEHHREPVMLHMSLVQTPREIRLMGVARWFKRGADATPPDA